MSKRLLRLFSFVVKEILDVMQQPRLVVTLVLGPFLILFLFGLGFTGQQRPVQAIVVVPADADVPAGVMDQVERYSNFLPVQEVLQDRQQALSRLQAGEVDLVAVLPSETYSAFLAGRQIVIEILINEFDPMRANYVYYISGFFVSDLNQQLLRQAAEQGKEMAAGLHEFSVEVLDQLLLIGEDLEQGNLDQAEARLDELLTMLALDKGGLDSPLQALAGVESVLITAGAPVAEREQLQLLRAALPSLRGELERIRSQIASGQADLGVVLDQLRTMRATMLELQSMADLLERIPAEVLVAPLKTTIENISRYPPSYVGYYAPAVLALLLQHIAVTFGSLTLVRERLLGAEEWFRVAPISPWEILTGKYASYCMLTLIIGLILSALIVVIMGVPLYGSLLSFGLVLALLVFSSCGWGMFISLFSHRESLSVQLSMLVLIASVFFSGFFMPLYGLRTSVHFVSYALPVTYGLQALRDIMLAGREPGLNVLLSLAGLGLGFYVLSMLIYSWQHKKE
jgi:ABC-2 type transport system permease protein